MLFGISGTELMVILVIALVLVDPDKLPDYARKVGRFIHSMRVRGQALSEQSNIDVHGLVQDSGINDIGDADGKLDAWASGLESACFRWRIGAGPLTCISRRA